MSWWIWRAAHVALLLACGAGRGVAQEPAPRPGVYIRIDTRYRWLPQRARAEAVPYSTRSASFRIDSVASLANGVRYVMREGPMLTTLEVARDRLLRVETRSNVPPRPQRDSAGIRSLERGRHMADGLWVRDARIWDFVPTAPPALRADLAWRDTVEQRASGVETQHQSRRIRRHARAERDTLIDGRVAWLVRDSSLVDIEETWPAYDYSFGADIRIERRASGASIRRYILDPHSGTAHQLRDSTVLSGTETWQLPGGRTIQTPTRLESWTTVAVMDSAAFAALQRAQAAERQRTYGGMVFTPRNALEERLARGDVALRDSLLDEWSSERDPDRRQVIAGMMRWSGVRVDSLLRQRALATGDTGTAYSMTVSIARSQARPLYRDEAELLVAVLKDPAELLARGLSAGTDFDALHWQLRRRPPAIATDPMRHACTPDACAVLAAQWDSASVDRRLRDIGLLTRYVLDPRTWYDTIVRYAGTGTRIGQHTLRFANGGVNDMPGQDGPLPAANAPWQAWRDWLGRGLDIHSANVIAIRLNELRTGRDIGAEVLAQFQTAESDSARLVFGVLASSLRDQAFTSADAAALLDRGVGGDSVLGMRLVVQLLARAAPAPDSTAESLLAHVLAYLFEREPLWEGAAPPREQLHARRPGEAFVLSDSLPPAVVAALRGRIPFITHAEWQSRDLRARAILYRLHRVRQAGEFVAVGWSYSERLSTPADAAPRHYAGGMDFVLRRTAGGWRAIRSVGWVT